MQDFKFAALSSSHEFGGRKFVTEPRAIYLELQLQGRALGSERRTQERKSVRAPFAGLFAKDSSLEERFDSGTRKFRKMGRKRMQ